jgi:hypothetical protein
MRKSDVALEMFTHAVQMLENPDFAIGSILVCAESGSTSRAAVLYIFRSSDSGPFKVTFEALDVILRFKSIL